MGEQIHRRVFGVARLAGNVCNSTVPETSWKKLGFQAKRRKKKTFVEEQIKKEKKRSRFDRPYIKIENFLNIFNRNIHIYIYISFIYKEFNDLELANLRTKFSYGKSERVKEKSTRAIECKS